jgi:hypothetical protein
MQTSRINIFTKTNTLFFSGISHRSVQGWGILRNGGIDGMAELTEWWN